MQVPFYFKNIVDSMNIDFVALGGTAWTVGGAMIVACRKNSRSPKYLTDISKMAQPELEPPLFKKFEMLYLQV